jgi:hypothetical protein
MEEFWGLQMATACTVCKPFCRTRRNRGFTCVGFFFVKAAKGDTQYGCWWRACMELVNWARSITALYRQEPDSVGKTCVVICLGSFPLVYIYDVPFGS